MMPSALFLRRASAERAAASERYYAAPRSYVEERRSLRRRRAPKPAAFDFSVLAGDAGIIDAADAADAAAIEISAATEYRLTRAALQEADIR